MSIKLTKKSNVRLQQPTDRIENNCHIGTDILEETVAGLIDIRR